MWYRGSIWSLSFDGLGYIYYYKCLFGADSKHWLPGATHTGKQLRTECEWFIIYFYWE